MAYNPGVQDISGQLLGRGLSHLGQRIGEGREKNKQQQDILKEAQGRAKALKSTLDGLEQMGIVPEGSGEKLVQAQENMSPKEFIGFADQQGKQLGMLIQAGGYAMQQKSRQEAQRAELMQQLAVQQEEARITNAISTATNTEGRIMPSEVVQGYIQSGGRDMKKLGEALKALESTQAESAWEPTGKQVTLPSGKQIEGYMGGKGSFTAVDDKPPEDTAAVRTLAGREQAYGKVRDMVRAGKLDEAHALALALGMSDAAGPITRDQLQRMFGGGAPEAKPAPTASPAATQAGGVETKVVGGRTYKKTASGWVPQ